MTIQITNLVLYKFVFMTALLIAENLFLMHMERRPRFALRLISSVTGIFVIVLFFPVLHYNALYSSYMFTVFFLATILAAKFCYDTGWGNCIFCTVAGYSIQHIASVCFGLVLTLGGFEQAPNVYGDSAVNLSPFFSLIFLQVYALVYWCLYHLFGSKIKNQENISVKNPAMLMLLALTVLVEIVLNALIIYRNFNYRDIVFYVTASLTNIICSISVLIIQFSLLLQQSLEEELSIVKEMWRQEQKKFQISKDTIDIINMKCHDMRHQIHNISRTDVIDPAALREMEESIQIYDSMAESGNQALDIILAEKSLYCQKNGIFISPMLDGKKLDFMHDTDIYSLFGNLLDNAIKSVVLLEPDKRVIGITIHSEGELLSVNSHNYYSGELHMKNGMPVTANSDTNYHGFGVKSMTMIVEKYGGTISFDAKDHIFNLNILLPIPAAQSGEKGR